MNYENEILNLLLNPAKINRFSNYDKTFEYNVPPFLAEIMKREDVGYVIETAAYLLGKTLEIVILEKLRPEIKRIWLSPSEVSEYIVTNLPNHLHEKVLEMMDACENAVSTFVEKDDYDTGKLLLDIQYIAETMCRKYKLYDFTVQGFTNAEIANPQEIYELVCPILGNYFKENGFNIEFIYPNMNEEISFVMNRDKERLFILANYQVFPQNPKFQSYKCYALKEAADKNNAKPYIIGVQVESSNPKAKEAGVVTLNCKVVVKPTELYEMSETETEY